MAACVNKAMLLKIIALMVLATLAAAQQSAPVVLGPDYVEVAVEGQSIAFTCEVTGSTEPAIIWEHDGHEITIDNDAYILEGGNSLRIQNLVLSDGGAYSCTAANAFGTASASWDLVVREATRIVSPPNNLTLHEGQEVRFTCSATADPHEVVNLRIVWIFEEWEIDFRQSERLLQDPRDGSLVILNAEAADAGKYTCRASNWLDTDEAVAYLSIHGSSAGMPPSITAQAEKVVAYRVHESVQLICTATGTPVPTLSWLMNNKPFDPAGNDGRIAMVPGDGVGTLIFARPLERDEAVYQCVAENEYGKALSQKTVFRMAYLEAFPASSTKNVYPSLGHSQSLRCTPPRSYPAPQIFWATVSDGEGLIPVDYDDRVGVDPEGNLHFMWVQREDNQDGRRYACVVQNTVMRSIQQGAYAVINPQEQNAVRLPPSILWQAPTHQLALRGHTWTISCFFSGNPAPRVNWIVVNGDMPLTARLDDFGRQLIIENVQPEQAGRYECHGINEESQVPIRRSFDLRVEAEPFWVEKPSDKVMLEGGTHVMNSKASGVPEPVYFWFINGVPLTEVILNRERFEIVDNALIVRNATLEDTLVVQCNATNKHGYAFANAYLRVSSLLPAIIQGRRMPQIQHAAVGQNVTLDCEVHGLPEPTVTWSRDGEMIDTSDTASVLEGGSLLLENITMEDAGIYTCTATNEGGTASATGTLVVILATQIVTPPSDITVEEHSQIKLSCSATTDPSQANNLVITWYKDGNEIDRDESRMYAFDNSLHMMALPLKSGTYTCRASNGIDMDEASAQVIIQGVPDPPFAVAIEECREKSATITWLPRSDNNSPLIRYLIQYNTSFTPDIWEEAIPDSPYVLSVGPEETYFTAALSPWGNYSFRVLAVNSVGTSPVWEGEHSPTVCSTPPGVPADNPRNVIALGDQPDKLVIYWDPMSKEEQNAPGFRYRVTWQREGGEMFSMLVTDPDTRYYIVPNQPTYVAYNVTVGASNAMGVARAPLQSVIGYSGEDVPVIAPLNVAVDRDSISTYGTKAVVYWDAVGTDASDLIRGFLRGYRIEYGPSSKWPNDIRHQDLILYDGGDMPIPIGRRVRKAVPDGVVSDTLSFLPANTQITVSVRLLNSFYAGPPSEEVTFTSGEGVPGPPGSLRVTGTGPDFLDISWEEPLLPNGVITGYVISYQKVTDLIVSRLVTGATTEPEKRNFKLRHLENAALYRVHVAAETSMGTGESIFVEAGTYLQPFDEDGDEDKDEDKDKGKNDGSNRPSSGPRVVRTMWIGILGLCWASLAL